MSQAQHPQTQARETRAMALNAYGRLEAAVVAGAIPATVDLSLSEALVIGLHRLEVRKFIAVFGHGSTEIAEVLRIYEEAGCLHTYNVRNEVEAAHIATILRWQYGERAAVITSIGPGALQAMAGSLASASNGIGVWHLYGDETTHGEGPNMQQIPGAQQGAFLKLLSQMGDTYSLHTPLALPEALRRGMVRVDHPIAAGPYYLLMPLNTQPQVIRDFNLLTLPAPQPLKIPPCNDEPLLKKAASALGSAKRVVVKVGGGGRAYGEPLLRFLEAVDGVLVHTPGAGGVIPYHHPRNMTVGGSKGSICGNFAMEQADLLVAVGTRAVCQSDSSGTAYPKVKQVIHLNGDFYAATHYNRGIALVGGIRGTLENLLAQLPARETGPSEWLQACSAQKDAWAAFKEKRFTHVTLYDTTWGREVLTQPAVIREACLWMKQTGGVKYFDAGDPQANGFQIVEDEGPNETYTETGASYMGFATSAVVAGGLAAKPVYTMAFTGDGSFMMNPQALIDAVAYNVHATILLMDNRAMGAIGSLQHAQYGVDYKTSDAVAVDYVAMAEAVKGVKGFFGGFTLESLRQAFQDAHAHPGLSLIHVPVYYGDDELGGLGAFGRWNVGNWCEEVQALHQKIGL